MRYMPSTLMQPGLGERYMPPMLTQPGLGDADLTHTDTYLVQQMHALAISIYQAHQRNDKATVSALLTRFQALANEYRSHGAADMAATDKWILAVGNWIDGVVSAIPDATAALPQAIGAGIFKAAIPFVLMYVGFRYLTSTRRRY